MGPGLRLVRFVFFGSVLAALSGCAMRPGLPPVAGVPLSGVVHGGQQPVSGATIQLYAAGASGYGSAATPLLTAPVITDSGGRFSITGDYTCPSPATPVYITATGGNPGLSAGSSNGALAFSAAAGNCGALSPATQVVLNEVTTVAAVWALQQFMAGYARVGTSSTNPAGLQAAFSTAATMVDISSGHVFGPSSTVVPAPEIDTLANVLAACVNSDGGTAAGTACGNLFAFATPAGGVAPSDTVAAALAIAQHPQSNVSVLYGLTAASAPFQPSLLSAPPDWTIGIQSYVGVYNKFNQWGVVDAANNYWQIGFYYTGHASISGPSPQLRTDDIFFQAAAPAFGLDGSLYVANPEGEQGYGVLSPSYVSTLSTAAGAMGTSATSPVTMTVGGNGNLWTFLNNGALLELTAAGTVVSPSGGFAGIAPVGASGQAVFDAAGHLYVSTTANTVARVDTNPATPVATSLAGGGIATPRALAIDHAGDVWVANATTSGGVAEFDAAGNALTITALTAAGVGAVNSIAVDGAGTVWIPNAGQLGVSAFSNARVLLTPTALGSAFLAGYQAPADLAIDGAGNLWLSATTNSDGCPLCAINVELVGVAAPVRTPVALAVKNNELGVRP